MSHTIQRSNGDWHVDAAGQLVEIDGLDKLDQDIGEELSCPYDPEDDSGNQLIAAGPNDVVITPITRSSVSLEIPKVIERYRRNQQLEPTLTETEAVSHIQRLVVLNDKENKTAVLFFLDVRSQAGRSVEKRKSLSDARYTRPNLSGIRSRISR